MAPLYCFFLLILRVNTDDYPFVSYNGMYNNPSHLTWGSTGSPLSQPLRPNYWDGTGSADFPDRASPRDISLAMFEEEDPVPLSSTYTALLPHFLEFVNRDILELKNTCPPEDISIKVSKTDPTYGNKTDDLMPLDRVSYSDDSGVWTDFPRQQLNSVTSWIDGSQVYGVSKGWADVLRSGVDGKLSVDSAGYPKTNSWGVPLSSRLQPHTCTYPDTKKLHLFGDKRSNENPIMYSLQWLLVSEHNTIAQELRTKYVMNDKWLFDKSRYMAIAKLQKILLYDVIGNLVGADNIPTYTGYKPTINPAINFLYAGAARYFLYTMVPDIMYVSYAGSCFLKTKDARLCNYYWDGQTLGQEYGPGAILRGLAYQPAAHIDMHIVQDIRSNYYGPMHWTRRDAIALAIQRGRDLGVPPLNTVLEYYTLDAMSWADWGDILDTQQLEDLKKLYSGDVAKVELFVGGMLLSSEKGEISEIFKRILVEQFVSLRDSDRFWFENPYSGLGCTGDEITEIRATTLRTLYTRNNVDIAHLTNDNILLLEDLSPACKLNQEQFNLTKCAGDMILNYDYNTTPYAIPLLVPVFLLFSVFLVILLTRLVYWRSKPRSVPDTEENKSEYGAITELQTLEGDREVELVLDSYSQTLTIKSKSKVARSVQWTRLENVPIMSCSNNTQLLLICIPKEYDIFLKFTSSQNRAKFLADLVRFSNACNVNTNIRHLKMKELLKVCKTEAHRQHLVDAFLSSIFSEMMKEDTGVEGDNQQAADEDKADKFNLKGVGSNVLECELTRSEFATALGLKPDQEFVEKVFPLVDKDKSGSISFREFLSFMVVYSSGSSSDKLKLIFNMYDYDKNGSLHVDEIKNMIRSMLEMVAASIKPDELDSLIASLFIQAGYQDKTELSFAEFAHVMSGYEKDLDKAQLDIQGSNGKQGSEKKSSKLFTVRSPQARGREIKRYIENYRLEIFYTIIFLLIVAVLFTERFITYSKYKFHTGYPQLLGYSLPMTRGSAAVLMFCFPLFLLAMCKNTITHLRGTFLKRYIPLDANRSAHIALGGVTLVFIVIHCVGHGYNFYMISTLSPDHLSCLMPKTWLDSKSQATVTGLLFGTITGVTGILLVLSLLTMYIFATQYARRYLYSWFWNTHHLYPFVLGLIVLHGTARLLQEPSFHYYLLGPAVLFTFDKLISISRKRREIPLLEANILPSEVTNLVFKRPVDFPYLAGQYVKIALVNSGTGRDEYHPFTLTSAPHEDFLSVHIRTCKGWTKLLRGLVITNAKNPERNPNLYVDGPFGEAHQDYCNYEVVILVGGGIGVTPFASILKDLIHKSTAVQSSLSRVKKVYFLWSTRTQRQFEWLLDIIGKCEQKDSQSILDTHIFITRFYQKSDLRTTMLYICERQFQGISNRSLFTGLKAITHFGRPDFDKIFEDIRSCHEDVRKFGVFVCGPPVMADSVTHSCSKITGKQTFVAYAENF